MPTIGIDFKIKMVQAGEQRVKLQLWDTAGQERFQTITTSYYKGAMGVLMVYDCTNRHSFQSISNWLKQINESAEQGVLKVLIANKVDKVADIAVPHEEARQLAQEHGLEFFMSSAKTGLGVEELFTTTCSKVIS